MIEFEKNVIFLLAKANQHLCAVFKKELNGYDLTPQQFSLLTFLWQKDGLSQAELSYKSHIDRATIGGLIDRLCKKGLVNRLSNPEDRRVYRICLTYDGKALEKELNAITDRTQDIIYASLSKQESDRLIKLLEKLRT